MHDVGASLERVRERIARAAERAGRRGSDVLLIGVSKTVEVQRIQEAVAAGVPALGENRVQEAKEKVAALGRPVPWHLIGHLQTNKVRDALDLFDLVHSLDRLDLASELDQRARQRGHPVATLVQVNVGGETNKAAEAWAAPTADSRIGWPRRSACGHGFSGSGVASQILTVSFTPMLARR